MDYYDGPQAGGTQGQLLQLIQYLDQSRYKPAITLLRNSEYIKHNCFPCPVKVLNITKLASMQSIFKILHFALDLHRENYQLVHCFFNDSSLIAPIFLKMFGIRVLVSRRDLGFWYTSMNLAVLRLVAPFVNRYVANSQAVKKIIQQREWVSSEKISVIYNGYIPNTKFVDENNLRGVSNIVPIVGIVANLRPLKRIDTLIEAFAMISDHYPDARLVIIGSDGISLHGGSMRKDLEILATSLGIYDQVIFMGGMEDPIAYINQFTVAVLCSESEGFSNSIIEYMRAGRPVICTNIGGNPELIQDEYNGFLVAVGDVKALADRLTQLLSNHVLARQLGEAGYETVRFYTHTRMVTEQMFCYDAILAESLF